MLQLEILGGIVLAAWIIFGAICGFVECPCSNETCPCKIGNNAWARGVKASPGFVLVFNPRKWPLERD